jgi:hypothetical protein
MLAIPISLIALALGTYAVVEVRALRTERGPDGLPAPRDESAAPDVADRLAVLETEVARLEAAEEAGPRLIGREASPVPIPTTIAPDLDDEAVAVQLESIVDTAVEKAVDEKARKFRLMQNKKPSIDVFASVLGLDEGQRELVEEAIVRSQREIRGLLETPTADGTLFLDELVELMARGVAGQESDLPAFIQRIVTERVPGTDETYGSRIEASKQRLREAFQREMSESQYNEFVAWQMDPTEVENVPGSPYADLGPQILERARELGLDLPDGR